MGKIFDDFRGDSDSGSSIRDIIMNHIKSISAIMRSDWHGGYFGEFPVGAGGGTVIVKKWVHDNREIYCNSVCFLRDVISPYLRNKDSIKGKKEIIASIKSYDDNFDKSHKKLVGDKLSMVKLHREMFRNITIFLEKNNYLAEGGYEEW